jgi:hypothetical protein
MALIDTLAIADELAQGGVFTREQAERLARVSGRAVTEALATKSDIAAIRADIAAFRTDVVNELTRTRADLERAIAETRADLERAIAQTRSDLEHSILLNRRELDVKIEVVNRDTVKWVAGILLAHGIAVIGVTVTLVKLL